MLALFIIWHKHRYLHRAREENNINIYCIFVDLMIKLKITDDFFAVKEAQHYGYDLLKSLRKVCFCL